LAKRIDEVFGLVKPLLTAERLYHTIGVLHTGLLLAEAHGESWWRVAVAALMHDCARDMSAEEIRTRLKGYGVDIAPRDEAFPQLWHAHLAAVMVQRELGIDDAEIRRAILLHPTGDGEMSRLEKIIFVADYVEPSRQFAAADELRALAYEDLEGAFRRALKQKVDFIRSEGKVIHERAIRALEFYLET
jgi:predicted HD superfamily hydrolase involved in NAD metabolism